MHPVAPNLKRPREACEGAELEGRIEGQLRQRLDDCSTRSAPCRSHEASKTVSEDPLAPARRDSDGVCQARRRPSADGEVPSAPAALPVMPEDSLPGPRNACAVLAFPSALSGASIKDLRLALRQLDLQGRSIVLELREAKASYAARMAQVRASSTRADVSMPVQPAPAQAPLRVAAHTPHLQLHQLNELQMQLALRLRAEQQQAAAMLRRGAAPAWLGAHQVDAMPPPPPRPPRAPRAAGMAQQHPQQHQAQQAAMLHMLSQLPLVQQARPLASHGSGQLRW
ncbi:hypothetical protein HYH03_012722 [Edaphochlamys debaryana]|uniref:Uncharacterized protein n=1 Tax=Edaphochlamys debaryana TaxID=47281 RepID=A0A835XS98_9CHLO|nr:hypothetical protein HYH03_012722 [Edaphochlamys debaryana]|eukprot:KAG2488722.1 hypothetical protein HYH03_012722 [Edaphochlamys debaryana]